jgi:hypothetical protein
VTELTIIVVALLALVAYQVLERRREREYHGRQVDRLLQRIQAPEIAIAEHAQDAVGEFAPPAVAMDDDGAHWEAKEQLADRLRAHELGLTHG